MARGKRPRGCLIINSRATAELLFIVMNTNCVRALRPRTSSGLIWTPVLSRAFSAEGSFFFSRSFNWESADLFAFWCVWSSDEKRYVFVVTNPSFVKIYGGFCFCENNEILWLVWCDMHMFSRMGFLKNSIRVHLYSILIWFNVWLGWIWILERCRKIFICIHKFTNF